MFTHEPVSEADALSVRIMRSSFSAWWMRFFCLVFLLHSACGFSRASVVFEMSPVDNAAALTGYVTYDLQVTTDSDWTSAAMLLTLDSGSIYQYANGSDNDPVNMWQTWPDPAMRVDTFVIGNIIGGAGDLGGTGFAFDTNRLDVSWYNIDKSDIGTTTIGRLTLSDDATGAVALLTGGQRFDVVLQAGVAPVVTAVVEEVPEAELEPETPTTPTPTGTYWDYSDWYSCPVFPGGYELPITPRYQTPNIDSRVWTPSDELSVWFTNKLYTDPTERGRQYASSVNDRNEFVINTSFVDTSLVLRSTDGATLPEPGTAVCLGLGLGLIVRRRPIMQASDCAHPVGD